VPISSERGKQKYFAPGKQQKKEFAIFSLFIPSPSILHINIYLFLRLITVLGSLPACPNIRIISVIFHDFAKTYPQTANCRIFYLEISFALLNFMPVNLFTKSLLVGGAIVALSAFSKAQAGGSLNFYPAAIQHIRFDGITPVATFGLAVQNPTGSRFVIKSLVGNLYANSILIGNVSSFLPFTVSPNSQAVYPLTVRLSLLGVVADIVKAFNGQGWKQSVEFKATANVDNWMIPIKINYQVG